MVVLTHYVCEDDATGRHTARGGFGEQAHLARRWEAQQPQHALGHALQDGTPPLQRVWVDLVQLVGAIVNDRVLRQPQHGARPVPVRAFQQVAVAVGVVVDKVAVGHVHQLLAVKVRELGRAHHLVRHQVVDIVGASGGGEAHVRHLHGRGPQREDFVARALCVPVQVDRHLNLVVRDALGDVRDAPCTDIQEVLRLGLDARAPLSAVVGTVRVAEDLDPLAVVQPKDAAHQMAQRVAAKVGTDVAHAQALALAQRARGRQRQRHAQAVLHGGRGGGVLHRRGVAPRDLKRQLAAHRVGDGVEWLH
mmetsp:Transcript_7382/g.22380  ORF Transcript_7382/g.22380 Transcript_7382/m.22380 type:complete len:306 (-) Transcript_7382:1437-2354(-)